MKKCSILYDIENTKKEKDPFMTDNFHAGAKIRNLRQRSNISMRQLARTAGISVSYLSNIEKDAVSPTLAMLRKILIALGTNLCDFFNENGNTGEKYFFRKKSMRTEADSDREYTFIFPHRDYIHFELMDEIYITGKNVPEFETLENDFAGYVVSGKIIIELGDEPPTELEPGDAFYVPGGMKVRGYCINGNTSRLITVLSPPSRQADNSAK